MLLNGIWIIIILSYEADERFQELADVQDYTFSHTEKTLKSYTIKMSKNTSSFNFTTGNTIVCLNV